MWSHVPSVLLKLRDHDPKREHVLHAAAPRDGCPLWEQLKQICVDAGALHQTGMTSMASRSSRSTNVVPE